MVCPRIVLSKKKSVLLGYMRVLASDAEVSWRGGVCLANQAVKRSDFPTFSMVDIIPFSTVLGILTGRNSLACLVASIHTSFIQVNNNFPLLFCKAYFSSWVILFYFFYRLIPETLKTEAYEDNILNTLLSFKNVYLLNDRST